MAGVKGKSGGARENSGGAREGAGRKPLLPQPLPEGAISQEVLDADDPVIFLKAVMKSPLVDGKLRIAAAKDLLPYVSKKTADGSKKEQRQEAAKKVSGRYARAEPPRLVSVGGKKA